MLTLKCIIFAINYLNEHGDKWKLNWQGIFCHPPPLYLDCVWWRLINIELKIIRTFISAIGTRLKRDKLNERKHPSNYFFFTNWSIITTHFSIIIVTIISTFVPMFFFSNWSIIKTHFSIIIVTIISAFVPTPIEGVTITSKFFCCLYLHNISKTNQSP